MNRAISMLFSFVLLAGGAFGQRIEIKVLKEKTRADVSIDGKLFTSLRWDERIRRPVLFPIMSAGGNFITRGFPVETRDNETINHPHQVGSSLVYGDVNNIDFWNNSPFRTAKELEHMGTIVLKDVVTLLGLLSTKSEWIGPNGSTILTEHSVFRFGSEGTSRWIERVSTLQAAANEVIFGDNKEGFFAVHLNWQLQQNDQFPVKITSATGTISDRTSNAGLSGVYFTSEGITGNALWGTPAKWAAVTGRIDGEAVTVAVFDHPKNLNFPSNMMVRPYGLLALNPFGQKAFDAKRPERKFVLRKGDTLRFRHRLLIAAGSLSSREIESEFEKFVSAS